MGTYKEYLSGEDMVSVIKAGLIAQGAVSKDAKVTLTFSRHHQTVITIEDDTVKGNEKEWAELKRIENRTHWRILGVMLVAMTIAVIGAVSIGNYLTSLTVDEWITIEQEESHLNGL